MVKMADFLDINNAWGEGTLQDWYMNSIDNTIPPIWTEEHISELCNDFYVIPREIPTADVTPVVHGYWKGYTTSAFYGCDDYGDPIYRDVTIYYCSLCHRKSVVKEKFCPNCGAKMDGKF